MSPVQPIPEGYHTLTPYLIVPDARREIDFLVKAFDAVEERRSEDDDGRVVHAQLRIGDAPLMLGESNEAWEPVPGSIFMYTEDCDAVYRQALEAGGTSIMEVADQFHGDRMGGVKDPAGTMWWIATHIEEVAPEELARRMKAR